MSVLGPIDTEEVRTIVEVPTLSPPKEFPLEAKVLDIRMVHISSASIEVKGHHVVAYLYLHDMDRDKTGTNRAYILESPTLYSTQYKQGHLANINICGFWIQRVCQCVEVQHWEDLASRLARVKVDQDGKVYALCHVGNNKNKANNKSLWFEFEPEMRAFRWRMEVLAKQEREKEKRR